MIRGQEEDTRIHSPQEYLEICLAEYSRLLFTRPPSGRLTADLVAEFISQWTDGGHVSTMTRDDDAKPKTLFSERIRSITIDTENVQRYHHATLVGIDG